MTAPAASSPSLASTLGAVDVVIPVYGAAEALGRCLDSVLAHTDLRCHSLTVVVDGPQREAVETQLTAFAGPPGVRPSTGTAGAPPRPRATILRQLERRGFVAAANRGIAATTGDIILLNSDTRVTAGWVEKLRAAAHSGPNIASVTPWSNSGTICSLPRWLGDNALPAGWDETRFNELIERVSLRSYPPLPTGVGFCLYLKRTAIESVGLFDEQAFGRGYGEENDWCSRATKAGWSHVLDDATFIFHEGQGSFGPGREARVRAAHGILRQRHPEYLPTVARFLREDPLRPLRERVLTELRLRPSRLRRPASRSPGLAPLGNPTRPPRRVLHLVHGWPPWNHAGTELYAAWLARWQADLRDVTVYARIADPSKRHGQALELEDHGVRVRLVVNNFTQRDPLSRAALRDLGLERDFAALLDSVRPDLLHVHHLAGHCATLPSIARRRGIRVLFQLQDWWAACARANLLDRDRRLCSGPGLAKCSRCLPLTGLPAAALWNRFLYAYRARAQRQALRTADAYVTGSEFLAASYRGLGLLRPEDRVYVRGYGVPEETSRSPQSPVSEGVVGGSVSAKTRILRSAIAALEEQAREDPPRRIRGRGPTALPIRCGFVGSLLPHKGAHVALAAFQGLEPSRATLEVWGSPRSDPEYAKELSRLAGPGVTFHDVFPETEKQRLLRDLDLLIVPSLGLESFGLVAYEAAALGTPVLMSARGAVPDLLAGTLAPCGASFDPDRPEELRTLLDNVIADPAMLDLWRAALPRVKSFAAHAEEIEEIYDILFAHRERRQ